MILGAKRLHGRAKADTNIVALLSLKLLLLAFFILLATMSRYEEERSRAVLDSVATTFNGRVTAAINSGNPDAALGLKDRQANLQRRIEALFKQTLPLVEVESSADGRMLRVEAAASTLFRDGEASLIPQRGVLLRRLAQALIDPATAPEAFQLEVMHATAPDADAGAARLAVDRTGTLVRHLSGLGLPRTELAAGLWPSAGETERLAFEIRLPMQAPQPNALPEPNARPEDAGAGEVAR